MSPQAARARRAASGHEVLIDSVEMTSRRAKTRRRELGERQTALLFLLPSLVGFLVFYVYPTGRGLWLSLTDWNLLSSPHFVGLRNYRALFSDPVFVNAVKVTVEYVLINIGTQTVIALGLAALMERLSRSVAIRGALLLPWLVPNVTIALLFLFILDPTAGIADHVLQSLGVSQQDFFGSTHQAIPTIALVNTWRHMGYTALLLFAGMQTIPPTLYEAAKVDGASEWKMFWRITMPLLRPVFALVMTVSVIGSFQIFDTVSVTTQGGPGNASRVLYYYIYEHAFTRYDMGYASAMAVVLFAGLIVFTFAQLRLLRAHQSDLA
jgi:multiple sugar transport system permease protein